MILYRAANISHAAKRAHADGVAAALLFKIGGMNSRAHPITNPDKPRQSSDYPLADDTKVGGVSSRSPISVGRRAQDKSRRIWATRCRIVEPN